MSVVPPSSHGVSLGSVVSVSGTAQAGYVLTATSATAADWEALPAPGALTLLSTTTRATDGTIDVSSISQAYNDLVMVLIARGTNGASSSDSLLLRLNNDSGSNYSSDVGRVNGAGASGVESIDGSSMTLSVSMGATGGTPLANSFSMYTVTISGYASTTWVKQVSTQGANAPRDLANNIVPENATGVWLSTAAVNRVTFFGNAAANLLTGSSLRIYGRL